MPDRFVRLKILAAKFFNVTPRRLTTLVLSLVITVALNAPAVAAGPLRVNPVNSRYFFDAEGATVFLAGSYQNPYNLLNGDSWDLTSYFDYLAQHNHNFTRLWAWEQSPWMFDSNGQVTYSLQPFERTGSSAALDGGAKFDLARFNQAYFDQLRTRVIQAGQRGIYVSVILFEGFSSQRRVREVNPWLADPFQRDNNINGINADPNGNGRGEEFFSLNYPSLTALQEVFVRKVVDTLNDLDNVLYEISGDTLATSLVWQYHMIDYLKQYQASKPNQHPVGISQFYARKLAEVLNSRADWIVTQGTDFNPPVVNSTKVVFNEGHPILFTYSNPDQWVWRAFTRGYNLIYPEAVADDAGVGARVHAAIAQSRAYSQFLNLRTMFPSTTLCSRDFCLGSQGSDYLVYLPSAGQVSIDLSAATVNFLTAWFDPVTGQTISGDSVSGGKRTTFTSPIRGQSVLQISPEQPASGQTSSVSLNRLTPSISNTLDLVESASASQEMVSTPTITPNGGIYSGSVRVSLSTKPPKATIYYTTDGTSPTQSSKKYTGAFTLSGSVLVKAKAFKNGMNPSAESSAWFADINSTSAFNFTLANSGDKSVSAGSSTATTITATLSSASSQSVSFTVSGLPSGATGAFSSASCTPTCSSTLTVSTIGSTPAGNYLISVSASGGGQTRTTSFNLSVSAAAFNFTLANSGDKSVSAGSSTATTITATLSSASSQTVSFTVSGLPSGATGAFSSVSCTPTCSSTLTVSTSGSTPAGNYQVSVSASGGGQTRTTSFNLSVSAAAFNFTLANSGDKSVSAGSSTATTITATLSSGSSESVSFTVSGLPSGATGAFSSVSCTPTCSSTLTVSTSGSTPAGNYQVSVSASGGGQTRTTSFNLSVSASAFNFTLANSGDKSVSAGSSTATTITATLSSASSQTVSFTVSGLPSGATGAFSSASCTPTCSSTLTVSTSGSTPAGNYLISVSASGGGQTRTTSFNLSVSTAPTPTTPPPTTPPSSWISCALEGYQCSFSGAKQVRYGTNGTYFFQTFSNGVFCDNSVFGDPLYGYPKGCDFRDASNLPFDFSIANSGNMSVDPGSSGASSISANLVSGLAQSVSFSVSGLPSGATGTFSSASCTLTCSTVLTISTSEAIPAGSYPITVTSTGGGLIRSTVFTLTLTLALPVTPPVITQASYYVGKNGSDSYSCAQARSAATPKLTIRAAITCVPPGQGAGAGYTVEVGAGTYTEPLQYLASGTPFPSGTSSGTSWVPFTLRAGPGTVTIKASGTPNLQISSNYPLYAIIQGFVFDGTNVSNPSSIVWGDCCSGVSYVRFQNNQIVNNFYNGMLVSHRARNIEILNNKFYGGSWGTGGTACGQVACWSYPIYWGASNGRIDGNEIHDFPSWGIHVYSADAVKPSNNVISNNNIYNFGWGDSRSSGILIYNGDSNTVSFNTISNTNGRQAISISSGATNTAVYDNTIK